MLPAILFAVAASLPLGVWPSEMGPAATTVQDVEFYLVDPEDDYTIVAVQPLSVPLRKAQPAELRRLAAVAAKLGADGVVLLGEMPEGLIPEDLDTPLPTTGRYSVAVFVSFEPYEEEKPALPGALPRSRGHRGTQPATPSRVRASAATPPASSNSRSLAGAVP